MGVYLTNDKKQEIFAKHGGTETNTGSVESQVALFTFRIIELTKHLKTHRKDYATQRSLQKLVGRRKRLLRYLKNKDIFKYRELIKELNIRG